MEAAERNPMVKKAVIVLEKLSGDERTRLLAQEREKARRDAQARETYVLWEGIEKGRQEGLQQGLRQGKQQGKEEGKEEAFSDVMKLLENGLTADELKERLRGAQ
jgi:flagellar biosynthesis/type III secretory pathway protein FliH